MSTFELSSQNVKSLVRAGEWWGYKFAPLLAIAYATVRLRGEICWPLLPQFGLLLASLTTGAIYVSVLNDWTDRAIDAAAGKANRLAHQSARFVGGVLAGCVAVGLAFGVYFWSLHPLIGLYYGGAWVAYSLYSLPPVRLKVRGLAGTLADAAGAHLFPQLFTVALVGYAVGEPPLTWWLAVGGWSLTCGLRNILWHQLGDVTADRQAGIRTFVTQVGDSTARRLGQWLFFPLELLAFLLILGLLHAVMPVVFLGAYAVLEGLRWRMWGLTPRVLAPHQRIVLNEYYSLLFPISLLLEQGLHYPPDALLLIPHLLLFGGHGRQVGQDGVSALRRLTGKLIRLAGSARA